MNSEGSGAIWWRHSIIRVLHYDTRLRHLKICSIRAQGTLKVLSIIATPQ